MKRFFVVAILVLMLAGVVAAQTVLAPTTITLLGIGHYTGATLQSRFPASNWAWYSAWVTDGPLCAGGGGGPAVLCYSDGSIWRAVSTGGGNGTGWGNVVPNTFPTIQAAINAGGPVIVLPSSTDTTSYLNPTNIRIQNYKQTLVGTDSLFFRDVSEWGPIDGKQIPYCVAVAGSNSVSCGGIGFPGFVNAPAPQGDVGKLILIPTAGLGTYGSISGTISIASTAGLIPGTPNSYQGVTFTDPGDCYTNSDGTPNWNQQPYGHIHLDGTGLPTGNVDFNNFPGKGCTHPPTKGTINTVGGTATFSGGSMATGDLVTSITSVTNSNTIVVADAAAYTIGGTVSYYGTDAYPTWQAACNNVALGGLVTGGTLTFSGIALISHGIDCNGAGLRILGSASEGLTSTIIYAGKTPNNMMANVNTRATGGPIASPLVPNSYILNLAQGGAAKIERLHLIGNTQAMPYGIINSFGSTCYQQTNPPNGPYNIDCFQAPGSGQFISQAHVIDQVVIGAFWGDNLSGGPRLQSCIFFAGFTGNADFMTMDHIYCYGADVGMDSVNDQATDLDIGKWQSDYDNIGLSFSGGIHIHDYYTEGNRADLFAGSPYWPGGFPEDAQIDSYGGESSAMDFGGSSGVSYNCWNLGVNSGWLGGDLYTYGRPDLLTMDFVNTNVTGRGTCVGAINWSGNALGNVLVPFDTEGNPGSNSLVFNGGWGGFDLSKFRFPNPAGYACGNGSCFGWGVSNQNLRINGVNIDLSLLTNMSQWQSYLVPVPGSPYYAFSPTMPTLLDTRAKSQVTIGSLSVQSVNWGQGPAIGYGSGPSVVCNNIFPGNPGYTQCGTTTYNYQITCTDSLGNESSPSPAYGGGGTNMVFNSGPYAPASLSSTPGNYIYFSIHTRAGCDKYNLYGDNGVGGVIGFLTSTTTGALGNSPAFADHGQWTKNTSIVAPTAGSMGSVSIAANLSVGGLTTLNNVNISGTCTGTGCGTGNGNGNMVYPVPGIANVNASSPGAWASSYNAGNQIPSSFIPTLNQNTSGNAATASALAATPRQCAGGYFATGITTSGAANCTAAGNASNQVVITAPPTTTPVIIKTPDLNTSITFGMTNGSNPSIASSTGSINFSNLLISDLAGTGSACLQTDPLGNVGRAAGACVTTATVFPAAGIPESNASATGWLPQSYNASNPIPASYIPILNQPTTGNAATASALTGGTGGVILQCTGGQFSTGIQANGNANCSSVSTSTGGSISSLTQAAATNAINNGNFTQNWNWSLTGLTSVAGLSISENTASTNTGASSALFAVGTLTSSTVAPFSALAHNGAAGVKVTSAGDIQAQGTATFIGPVRVPSLISAGSLSTDASGNIQAGSASNSWSALQNPTANLNLSMGAYTTTMNMAPNGPINTAGLLLNDSGTSSPTNANIMFRIQSTHANLLPLSVTTAGSGGFLVSGNTGNVQTVGNSKFVGPVQLTGTGMNSLTSLGTDASGNIVPGTSSGGLGDPGANGVIKRTALNTTAIAVAADYPTLNQNTTGTAAGITSNGTSGQLWGMNASATAQGWQTVATGGTVPFSSITTGTSINQTLTTGNASRVTYTSGGIVDANWIDHLSVSPVSSGYLHYNGSAFVWDTPSTGVSSITWNLPVYVVQGNGTSLGGGFTAASAPSVATITSASNTQPAIGGAAYPAATKGTQWMEWHKALESTFTTIKSIVATFYSDATSPSGNAVWDVQLACAAIGSATQPTYGSAISLSTQAVSVGSTRYQVSVTSPTFSCAGGSTIWLRLLLDSANTTVTTGNLVLTDAAVYTQ